MLQTAPRHSYGVFYAWERESLACHYERDPPIRASATTLRWRSTHTGTSPSEASVAYPRRVTPAPIPSRKRPGCATCEQTSPDVARPNPDCTALGVPVETRDYQLTGAPLAAGQLYDPTTLAPARRRGG